MELSVIRGGCNGGITFFIYLRITTKGNIEVIYYISPQDIDIMVPFRAIMHVI